MRFSWSEFIEYRIRPNLYFYFYPVVNMYYRYLSPLKAELKSLLNYYILRNPAYLELEIPKSLTIVPTNICNANCVFCAYDKISTNKGIMPIDLFKRIINDYKNLGGKALMFSPTIGEVLINNEFFKMVSYAKELGFFVSVFSNGVLLNFKENYKKMIDSGIDDLFISIGDLIPKVEAEVFGITKKFALNKLKGIEKLIRYKEKSKSKIKITLGLRSKRTFKQVWISFNRTVFIEFFKKKLFHIIFAFGYDNWCGNVRQKDLLGIMKLKKPLKIRKYPCSSLSNVSVLPDGDVRLCACRIKDTEKDDLVIGNLYKKNLKEILKSKEREKILKNWTDGKLIETCIECSRYYCNNLNIIKNKLTLGYIPHVE